jgi:hypothetical protein
MALGNKLFFGLVSALILGAAGCQFYIVYQLDDECAGKHLDTAPIISGSLILGSFVFNSMWLMSKGGAAKRVALGLWVTCIMSGLAAAGATLGQVQLYANECTGLTSSVIEEMQGLAYGSLAAVIVATAVAHSRSGNSPGLSAEEAQSPEETDNLIKKQPLRFV